MNTEKREMFEKLNKDLQAALKERQELRLSVLRMLKSKILYVNARGDMPDAEILKIMIKYAKDLKESIEEFTKVGRSAEVEKTQQEIAIVQEYLPRELSPEEVKALVQQAATDLGASSIKEMGKVMKEVMVRSPGVDGKIVSELVREILK